MLPQTIQSLVSRIRPHYQPHRDAPPDGWRRLDKSDRDSNIAWFLGGYECKTGTGAAEHGDEVLVWLGDENEDGSYTLQSHLGNDIPSEAICLIEVLVHGELIAERFAQSRDQAARIAHAEVKKLTNNE